MATAPIPVKSENCYRGLPGIWEARHSGAGWPPRLLSGGLKENCPLTVSSHHRQIGGVFKTEGVENRYTIQYNPFRCASVVQAVVEIQFCAKCNLVLASERYGR